MSYMENLLGYKIAASWNVLTSPKPQAIFFKQTWTHFFKGLIGNYLKFKFKLKSEVALRYAKLLQIWH